MNEKEKIMPQPQPQAQQENADRFWQEVKYNEEKTESER